MRIRVEFVLMNKCQIKITYANNQTVVIIIAPRITSFLISVNLIFNVMVSFFYLSNNASILTLLNLYYCNRSS